MTDSPKPTTPHELPPMDDYLPPPWGGKGQAKPTPEAVNPPPHVAPEPVAPILRSTYAPHGPEPDIAPINSDGYYDPNVW